MAVATCAVTFRLTISAARPNAVSGIVWGPMPVQTYGTGPDWLWDKRIQPVSAVAIRRNTRAAQPADADIASHRRRHAIHRGQPEHARDCLRRWPITRSAS